MLSSFRKVCAVAIVASAFSAGGAQAESVSVMIMDGGFYPAVSYIQHGDTLVFTNASDGDHEIVGADDAWESGPIAIDATFQLVITDETPPSFSAESAAGEVITGEFTYEPAPLSE